MFCDRQIMLVTFEGIDGGGKTTVMNAVTDCLQALGEDVVNTREPGGSRGAEKIRALLETSGSDLWSATSEVLLFVAARRDHVERTIIPAMEKGHIVLCDRFVDSTRAYQGGTDQALRAMIDDLHERVIGIDPDLTFILDLPADIARDRTRRRGHENWNCEGLGRDMELLRKLFLEIAEREPERCVVLDGLDAPNALARQITDRILLGKRS